jgi:hypothetical protein
MNSNKENIYCNESGNIFNSLNNSLQDSVYPHPIIILITLFSILKLQNYVMSFPRTLCHKT